MIGVLDIFGFESFKVNSFEQLCVNYTNEKLQQLFNQYVFQTEQALYKKEGIEFHLVDFPDNASIISLITAKPFSIFALIDEECKFPNGSVESYCNKLRKHLGNHERFAEVRTNRN